MTFGRRIFIALTNVALLAGEFCVFPGQGEFGAAGVIEFDLAPVPVPVAIGTIVSQSPLMRIVIAVAIHANARRRSALLSRLMATGAGDLGVGAG